MTVYLAVLAGIIYLIYTWVTKFIQLKQEQNDLLREIIKKMDHNQSSTKTTTWKTVH